MQANKVESMIRAMRNNTTDLDLQKAEDNDLDVVSAIIAEGCTDDTNESRLLIELYKNADGRDRALMDTMLICICGWSMKQIILRSNPMED